jgi:hypothetical protein
VNGLNGGQAAERLRQAAAELREGEPDNARALLGDALNMAAWKSHQAQFVVNDHLAWLAERYPPPRESHAERARRLGRDMRAADEIPQPVRDGLAAELDGAAANLAAGRPVWAFHALTRVSRPAGNDDGNPRQAALRLRAAALAIGVGYDVRNRTTMTALREDLGHRTVAGPADPDGPRDTVARFAEDSAGSAVTGLPGSEPAETPGVAAVTADTPERAVGSRGQPPRPSPDFPSDLAEGVPGREGGPRRTTGQPSGSSLQRRTP